MILQIVLDSVYCTLSSAEATDSKNKIKTKRVNSAFFFSKFCNIYDLQLKMDDDDLFGAFEDDDSSIKKQPEIKSETGVPSSNE